MLSTSLQPISLHSWTNGGSCLYCGIRYEGIILVARSRLTLSYRIVSVNVDFCTAVQTGHHCCTKGSVQTAAEDPRPPCNHTPSAKGVVLFEVARRKRCDAGLNNFLHLRMRTITITIEGGHALVYCLTYKRILHGEPESGAGTLCPLFVTSATKQTKPHMASQSAPVHRRFRVRLTSSKRSVSADMTISADLGPSKR